MDAVIIFNREKRKKHKCKVAEVTNDTFDSKHLAANITFQALSIESINNCSLKRGGCVYCHKGKYDEVAVRVIHLEKGHYCDGADAERQHKLVAHWNLVCI